MNRKAMLVLAVTLPTLAGAAVIANCYVLKSQKPGKEEAERRKGQPLSQAQVCGVRAAIDLLAQWEANCGVTSHGGGGGIVSQAPSSALQELLDNGSICEEIAGEALKPQDGSSPTGATTSNPDTGNGTGTDGTVWTATGHSGLKINPHWIPKEDANGAFRSGGKQFDIGEVAGLALLLLHGKSHLQSPNHSAESGQEYEDSAYTFAAQEACKVAGCGGVSNAEKEAACTRILTANRQLCAAGAPQIECAACPNATVDPSNCGSSSQSDNPQRFVMPHVIDQPHDVVERFYGPDPTAGVVRLFPRTNRMAFPIEGSSPLDFAEVIGLSFWATSFTFSVADPSLIYVGGVDPSTRDAELVVVVIDPPTAAVWTVYSLFEAPGLKWPLDLSCIMPATEDLVFFLASQTHSVGVFTPGSGEHETLATHVDDSALIGCEYISAWSLENGGGYALTASNERWSTMSSPNWVTHMVDFLDVEGDGSFD